MREIDILVGLILWVVLGIFVVFMDGGDTIYDQVRDNGSFEVECDNSIGEQK